MGQGGGRHRQHGWRRQKAVYAALWAHVYVPCSVNQSRTRCSTYVVSPAPKPGPSRREPVLHRLDGQWRTPPSALAPVDHVADLEQAAEAAAMLPVRAPALL